ncbi:MAG: hypothetical protein ACRD3Q_06440 [Terriglobales bacterium]
MEYRTNRVRRTIIASACVITIILLLSPFSIAQSPASAKAGKDPAGDAIAAQLNKYPGLLPELAHLFARLKSEIQFPPERQQSDLLPLLPGSTTYYAGFPNYGETAHQALTIFRDELQRSAVLRNWWQQGDMAKTGPQIESSIEKFYELSQYLGEEWVIDGQVKAQDSSALFVAQVRKPGLKDFLQRMVKELPASSHTDVRVVDVNELASASGETKPGQMVVLVRPDFVVVGSDVKALRSFNDLLDSGVKGEFPTTPFGQRLALAYRGGAVAVAAADLHEIMAQLPKEKPASEKSLDRSGFKDAKYLVWDHKSAQGESLGEMELSFVAPRHGIAAWLAAPASLAGLDFVSAKAAIVASIRLKNLAEIFDDVKALSTDSNPGPLATLPQMEQAMHVNLRDDILRQLQGEITVTIDDLSATQAQWKAIFRINDSERLQSTIAKLLQSAPVLARQSVEDGVTYHSLTLPNPQKATQIVYAFVDGFLIVASSHDAAAEAIRIHKSGESLAKSANFLASFPPGYSPNASALIYEDASAMTSFRLRQVSPEMAEAMSHSSSSITPIVFCAYGEEKAIRGVSSGGGGAADASAILLGAAIAIPNLIRARGAADESAAVGTLRAVNSAQTIYSSKYLQRGYARDLASLGPDPQGNGLKTANHATLIDADLGSPRCTTGAWCDKSGYRFTVAGVCQMRSCSEFVAVATPVSSAAGARTFCSTSDAVIRFQAGPALMWPISAAECKRWTPLQAADVASNPGRNAKAAPGAQPEPEEH